MATSLTYDSLVTDLRRYVQRGTSAVDASVNEEIPRIINRQEVAAARKLKIQGDQITVTSYMNPSANGIYAKPADWLDTISINFGTGESFNTRSFLYPRSYEYLVMYWPNRTTRSTPEFYADYDLDHWLFAPSPDQVYPYEVLYHGTPALLDSSNQTNWLTEHLPDMFLNDCVVALGTFVGWKEDRLAPFRQARDEALGAVSTQELMKIIDRATTRRSA